MRLKAWVHADSSNGYMWNWKLYTGKEDIATDSTLGFDDHRLTNKGYHMYMEIFYSSPAVFRDLRAKGFEGCGTIR